MPICDNIWAHYKMDELALGADRLDDSYHGRQLINTWAQVSGVPGLIGNAVRMPHDAYLDTIDTLPIIWNLSGFTINFWLRLEQTNYSSIHIGFGLGGVIVPGHTGTQVFVDIMPSFVFPGRIEFYIWITDENSHVIYNDSVVPLWNHVLYDGLWHMWTLRIPHTADALIPACLEWNGVTVWSDTSCHGSMYLKDTVNNGAFHLNADCSDPTDIVEVDECSAWLRYITDVEMWDLINGGIGKTFGPCLAPIPLVGKVLHKPPSFY